MGLQKHGTTERPGRENQKSQLLPKLRLANDELVKRQRNMKDQRLAPIVSDRPLAYTQSRPENSI